ncbi:hypothetical protein OBK29_04020 [Empedobacter falsenii]|uniref:hypothetical protein n=1 Tax=Empedobacter falsenii TaxID=343874 RepID=UPI003A804760
MKEIRVYLKSENHPLIILNEKGNTELINENEFISFKTDKTIVTFMKSEIKYWTISNEVSNVKQNKIYEYTDGEEVDFFKFLNADTIVIKTNVKHADTSKE